MKGRAFVSSVIIGIVLAILALAVVQAGEIVSVKVSAPAYVEGTFDATIAVDNITDFNSGQFDLSFDSSVVNVTDVADGSVDGKTIRVGDRWGFVDEDTIKVMLELSGTTTVSGSGYLAKITFVVKGDEGKESALKLSNGGLVKNVFEDERAIPEAIEANWNDATVKVGAGREEKKEEKEEQPSDIIAWDPAEEVVSSTEGESMTFGISVDQTSDIRWQINGTEVETKEKGNSVDGGFFIFFSPPPKK